MKHYHRILQYFLRTYPEKFPGIKLEEPPTTLGMATEYIKHGFSSIFRGHSPYSPSNGTGNGNGVVTNSATNVIAAAAAAVAPPQPPPPPGEKNQTPPGGLVLGLGVVANIAT